MNCNDLRDHYELYALGVAEEPERTEIRAHLDRNCEVCMAEMKQSRQLGALLAGGSPTAAPPARLRRRILASAGVEHRGIGWIAALAGVSALSLCAALYFSGRERDFSEQARVLREQARSQGIELTRLNEAFAILNGADTTVTTFGDKQPKPKGKAFVNPSMGVLLIATGLPPAPKGKMYELWMIPKKGNPAPAGMFQSGSDASAMYTHRGWVDMSNTAAIAVTMEVEAGVDAPTSTPIIVAPVSAALQ
jgi:anti-sigma-K factor RskA